MYGRVGSDFNALRLGGLRHSLGDSAHAAFGDAEIFARRQDVAADVGARHNAARRARVAGVLRVNKAAAYQRGLEMLFHKIAHIAGEHALKDGFVGTAAQVGGDLGERGRIRQEVALDDAARAPPERRPIAVAHGVRRRYAGNALGCALVVVPAQQATLAGQRRETDGIYGVDVQPVIAQSQVADNLVLQQVADVGAAGHAKAGEEFLRDASAAHKSAALQREDAVALAGEVVGGD